jgi:hypothetical protein
VFKRTYYIRLLLILLWGPWNIVAYAQKPVVSASLDTGTIRFGEQTAIRLKLTLPRGHLTVSWPQLPDSLIKGIQVLRVSKTDTVTTDSGRGLSQYIRSITITSFDSGYYAIPPFHIIINGDSVNALLTDAMLLHVQGMKVDTTLAIKDIKQPLGEPFDWHELIPWIKWIALALAGLLGTYSSHSLSHPQKAG